MISPTRAQQVHRTHSRSNTDRRALKIALVVALVAAVGLLTHGDGLQYHAKLYYHFSDWCESVRGMRYGLDIATGDLDDDGNLDLIVSSDEDLYVYYGSGDPNFSYTPDTIIERASAHVATADLNGDGFDDLVAGDTSDVMVWYGGAARLPASLTSWSADWSVQVDGTAWVSTLVANAGDRNGDGIDDIVVGLPHAGPRAFVIHGFGAGGPGPGEPHGPSPIPYAEFLRVSQSAGDVNGDGTDDFAFTTGLGTSQPQVHVSLHPRSSTAWAAGLNNQGQIGDGTNTNRPSPVQVGAGGVWVAVSSTGAHTLAIDRDGALWAWGENSYGQLGDGTTTTRNTPVRAGTDTDWVEVVAGFAHTLAIKSDGSLWGWGWNGHGNLGDGTTVDRHVPTRAGNDTDWTAAAAGFYYTLALKSDGTLWAWGRNSAGQLGLGHTAPTPTPTRVGTDSDWFSIDAGDKHSLALKSDATMWAWGSNGQGRLGDGTTTDRHVPTAIGTSYSDWMSLGAGLYHNLALRSDGSLWAWGANWYGEVGDGTTLDRYSPIRVGSASDWAVVDAGGFHSAALKMNGEMWAWGANSSGQLGNGTTDEFHSPIRIGDGRDWLAIASGSHHTFGLNDEYASDWFVEGIAGTSSNWFGEVVGSAGDLNGDGFGDLYVADPWHDGNPGVPGHLGDWGRFYVWYGGRPQAEDPTGLGGGETILTADVIKDGDYADSARFATTYASGDLDGDDHDDLVVGDPRGADWCFDNQEQQDIAEIGFVVVYLSLGSTDQDGDGHTTLDDCDDSSASIFPGAPQSCDGINNDCLDPQWPAVPLDEIDNDADGYAECHGDCDDADADLSPGQAEICDLVDNDCDGVADDGLDADGDSVVDCLDACPQAHDPAAMSPAALVTLNDSGELAWVDLITGAETLLVGALIDPLGVALESTGSMAYYTVQSTGGSVVGLELASGSSFAIKYLGVPRGLDLDPTEAKAYVAIGDLGELKEVELQQLGAVATIATGLSSPADVAVTADGQSAYVTEQSSGELSVVDIGLGTVTVVASGLSGPTGVALNRAETIAYVAEFTGDRLSAVDLTTGQVTVIRDGLDAIWGVELNEAETTVFLVQTGPPLSTRGGSLRAVDLGTGSIRTVATGLSVSVDLALAVASCPSNVCNDSDGDGYGDPGVTACPEGALPDCDDTDQLVHPGYPDLCDGLDNDCDAATEDGSAEIWFAAPCDGPDLGSCQEGQYFCVGGQSSCNDTSADDIEVCDGYDNDCDFESDEGLDLDQDGDSYNSLASCNFAVDCDDTDPQVHPDHPEVCDGKDNDCDPATPDGSGEDWLGEACDGPDSDMCLEGAFTCGAGAMICSDATWDTVEVCDGTDNDCDGAVDEDLNVGGTCTVGVGECASTGTTVCTTGGSGTVLVRDANAGAPSAYPGHLANLDGVLLFTASDGVHSTEVWRSDGTLSGTRMIKDIYTGGTFPFYLTAAGNQAFFVATDGTAGRELWKTDGTTAGTVLVKDINPGRWNDSDPEEFTPVGATVFFRADDGANGVELWKSDGTELGTQLVKDINPGSGSSGPTSMVNVNGTLFFFADDGSAGKELWKSDGTDAGTMFVSDIHSGATGSYVGGGDLLAVGDTLYFEADDGTHGPELWRSDGTLAGTQMVKDIFPGSSASSLWAFAAMNGTLFFLANDGIHGEELWKSDGNPWGTVMVKDIYPGFSSSTPVAMTDVDGTLFFSAIAPGTGRELWKSDGTTGGTVMVRDIYPGPDNSNPVRFAVLDGKVVFKAHDSRGSELWVSDGTLFGTEIVRDIRPGVDGSDPGPFVVVGAVAFFAATDGALGRELWMTDGTALATECSAVAGTPALEICDNLDNDCDGSIDGFTTTCGVGACLAGGVCDSGIDSCLPGDPLPETCDGLDNDCDGSVPSDDVDGDFDGSLACEGDCNDANPAVYPGASEINDGLDNQCPGDLGYGVVDELSGTIVPGERELCWPHQAGATQYEVARSTDPDFSDGCFSVTVGTTCLDELEHPAPNEEFYYLVRPAGPFVGSWGTDSTGAERIVSCGGACAHSSCEQGAPLDATCDSCVSQICAVDPVCCDRWWDPLCVEKVQSVCGSLVCEESMGACSHPLCMEGESLTAGCDAPPAPSSCVAAVCQADSYCCEFGWDALCVDAVSDVCELTCNGIESVCDDGADNDADNLQDCEDPDCAAAPPCQG